MVRWEPPSPMGESAVPAGGGLRLVAYRRLYEAGVAVSRSAALAKLAPEPAVTVAPADADRLGLRPGDDVTVRSSRGVLTLVLRIDPRLAPGRAALPFDPAGSGAAELIEAGAVTEVTLEPAHG
jgi:predicted molibdopterin-dependent oxidoreductase YjgC